MGSQRVRHNSSLSTATSQSLLKLVSIESVMPSNHLALCCLLPLLSYSMLNLIAHHTETSIREVILSKPRDTKSEKNIWLVHLKRHWCWERLRAGGKGDDRGWDSWMASLTQWTWIWVNSGSWWWTGRPGMLKFMGVRKSQTWLSNWTELNWSSYITSS